MRDVSTPPISAVDISAGSNLIFIAGNARIIRANPYPPSLSSTAARTIDPATGASTCAFGSHRCTRNSGNLTMNAIIDRSHSIVVP